MLINKNIFIYAIFLSISMLFGSENENSSTGTFESPFTLAAQRTVDTTIAHEHENFPLIISEAKTAIEEYFSDPQKQQDDIYSTIKTIDDCIPCTSNSAAIIITLSKECSLFNQKINAFIEQFVTDGCTWKNNCKKISPLLKNYITGKTIQNTHKSILIPYPKDKQKTVVTFTSPRLVTLLHFISSDWKPDCGLGRWQSPYTQQQLRHFNIHNDQIKCARPVIYDILLEINEKEKYTNTPIYHEHEKDGSYPGLYTWHQESQLHNHIASFPDHSFVTTYPWGGILLCKDNQCAAFAINNSISSVSCNNNNKHIALGSYDGTITIIDITRLNQDSDYQIKEFNSYFDYGKQNIVPKKPFIIASHQLIDQKSIRNIMHIDENCILFSTDTTIHSLVYENEHKASISLHHESETIFTSMTAYNDLICYGTQDGYVTICTKKKQLLTQQITFNDSINALCIYKNDQEQLYLVTGTSNGILTIWQIPQMHNKYDHSELFNTAEIQHDHPIYSIEISPDTRYILVKTTETVDECKYIDHAHIYSTFHNLIHHAKAHRTQFKTLQTLYTKHLTNPQNLYAILTNNIQFFQARNTTESSQLYHTITEQIIALIQKQDVASLKNLKKILTLFPTIRIGAAGILTMSGASRPKDENPLSSLNNQIKNMQTDVFTQFVQQAYKKSEYSRKELNQLAALFYVKIEWGTLFDDTIHIQPTEYRLAV